MTDTKVCAVIISFNVYIWNPVAIYYWNTPRKFTYHI